MKKYMPLLVVLFSGVMSLCDAGGLTPVPVPTFNTGVQQPRASFTRIDSVGHFNITIKPTTAYTQNSCVINSPLINNSEVYAAVMNGTLFLRQSPAFPTPINVTVYMNTLTTLRVFDGTSVFGKRVRAQSLIINANTEGTITLTGSIMLREATIAGPTQLNMSWVYGNAMDLFILDNAYVNLSGNVNIAHIKMKDQSFLDARYLRTKHTWIKTDGKAQAQVIASRSVQAYPSSYSNIYYYKTPVVVNRINNDSGNTLQLGWSR